ncbi:hypothetical protein J6590_070551 [Homalodisca vitripennis]|nr:hypothetical protein J6590_070551 [Homalodisca vitripennis]
MPCYKSPPTYCQQKPRQHRPQRGRSTYLCDDNINPEIREEIMAFTTEKQVTAIVQISLHSTDTYLINTFTAGDEHAHHAKWRAERWTIDAWHTAAAFILPQCELSSCPGRLLLYNMYNSDRLSLYDFRVRVLEDLLPPKEAPLLITQTRNSMHRLSKITKRKENGKSVTRRCRVCYQEG